MINIQYQCREIVTGRITAGRRVEEVLVGGEDDESSVLEIVELQRQHRLDFVKFVGRNEKTGGAAGANVIFHRLTPTTTDSRALLW